MRKKSSSVEQKNIFFVLKARSYCRAQNKNKTNPFEHNVLSARGYAMRMKE
jgi:hypothetical protein